MTKRKLIKNIMVKSVYFIIKPQKQDHKVA